MGSKHLLLLQYKSNSHRLALRNLHRQGFETFLPMQDVTQRHSTKFVQQRRPLFSGYMFVSFALDTAPWRKINSTVGVARLVSFDGQSKALPPDLIAGLMARCDTQAESCRQINLRRAMSSKL